MKEGELVERGTHDELLAQKSEYAKMYQVQAQAFTAVSVLHVFQNCFNDERQ
jgi:ABC-type transport system involved in cytochrome bd biosynthesis fused ATPase/permease subunit